VREDGSVFPFSLLRASKLQHKESRLKDVRRSEEMARSGPTDQQHPLEMRFLFLCTSEDSADSSQDCTSQAGYS